MLNLLLSMDVVGNIAKAYIFLFVVILIIPFIRAAFEIARIVKERRKENSIPKFNIVYDCEREDDRDRV